MKTTGRLTLPLSIAFLLFWMGCGPGEMTAVQTLSAGTNQIVISAPDGAFQNGENAVRVQVFENGQPLGVEQAQLALFMPPMGTMGRMDTQAELEPNEAGDALTGTIRFSMTGGWNGQIQVQTESGPVSGNFKVQVAE